MLPNSEKIYIRDEKAFELLNEFCKEISNEKLENNKLDFFNYEKTDNISLWKYGTKRDKDEINVTYKEFVARIIYGVCQYEGELQEDDRIIVLLHNKDFSGEGYDRKLMNDKAPISEVLEGLEDNISNKCEFYAFSHQGNGISQCINKLSIGVITLQDFVSRIEEVALSKISN